MKIKKCFEHESPVYTLENICPKCKQTTKEAHYKFIKIKDVKEKYHSDKNK